MRTLALPGLFALAVGYILAHFLVLFYTNWYFGEHFWLKVLLLMPLLTMACLVLLFSAWRRLMLVLGTYWIITHLLLLLKAKSLSLAGLEFVSVLDYEVIAVWLPTLVIAGYAVRAGMKRRRAEVSRRHQVTRELKLRRRLRQRGEPIEPEPYTEALGG